MTRGLAFCLQGAFFAGLRLSAARRFRLRGGLGMLALMLISPQPPFIAPSPSAPLRRGDPAPPLSRPLPGGLVIERLSRLSGVGFGRGRGKLTPDICVL